MAQAPIRYASSSARMTWVAPDCPDMLTMKEFHAAIRGEIGKDIYWSWGSDIANESFWRTEIAIESTGKLSITYRDAAGTSAGTQLSDAVVPSDGSELRLELIISVTGAITVNARDAATETVVATVTRAAQVGVPATGWLAWHGTYTGSSRPDTPFCHVLMWDGVNLSSQQRVDQVPYTDAQSNLANLWARLENLAPATAGADSSGNDNHATTTSSWWRSTDDSDVPLTEFAYILGENPTSGAADRLAVDIQPDTPVDTNVPFSGGQVSARNSEGALDNTVSGDVNIAVVGDATLGGTLTATMTAGVAVLPDDLTLVAGTDSTVKLRFTKTGLTTVDSGDIVINPPAATATKLAITSQPGDTLAGAAIGPILVEAHNDDDELDSLATGDVTAEILAHPAGEAEPTLHGTLTKALTNGIANFNDLISYLVGTGYQIRFTHATLTQADSSAFAITATGSGNNLILPAEVDVAERVLTLGDTEPYIEFVAVSKLTGNGVQISKASTADLAVFERVGNSARVDVTDDVTDGAVGSAYAAWKLVYYGGGSHRLFLPATMAQEGAAYKVSIESDESIVPIHIDTVVLPAQDDAIAEIGEGVLDNEAFGAGKTVKKALRLILAILIGKNGASQNTYRNIEDTADAVVGTVTDRRRTAVVANWDS